MLRSLDTNILVYAANDAAPEHRKARSLVERVAAESGQWLLSSQVLWEFYRALRNPVIQQPPARPREALARVRQIRSDLGARECAYEPKFFDEVAHVFARSSLTYRATHDVVLAVTLVKNGVTEFYTRNAKDFADLGFERVIDPIA